MYLNVLEKLKSTLQEVKEAETPVEFKLFGDNECIQATITYLYLNESDNGLFLVDLNYSKSTCNVHETFFCDKNLNISQNFLRGVLGTEFFKALSALFKTVLFFTEDNGYPTYTIVDGNLFVLNFSSTKAVDVAKLNDFGDFGDQVKAVLKYFIGKAKPGVGFMEKHKNLAAVLEKFQRGEITKIPTDMLEEFNQYLRKSKVESFAQPSNVNVAEDTSSNVNKGEAFVYSTSCEPKTDTTKVDITGSHAFSKEL